ncbi:hypothetical protein [Robiginitomaculum antarcticum]|uniref:hypothetical protein n=1 Tax=Robiginitomaculum antarcticum TaxID=437507 RepID=UPI00036BFD75|nr:hypothetical protein [Robiginitomaculum antarcticum]
MTIKYTEFTPWPERSTADPRRATQAQFMHGMCEILASEGPLQALPLFQAYAKAAGLLKIASTPRKLFERALLAGEKNGEVIIEREDDPETNGLEDSVCWVTRLPTQQRVIVRDLGTRGFADIPMSELEVVIGQIKAANKKIQRDDIYRAVLDHYGLLKVTALVKRRLNKVLEG